MSSISVLLKVNDLDTTAQVATPFTVGRPKLWGEKSGRLLSGKMDAILVGIFPKLEVDFYPDDNNSLVSLLTELDKPSQNIQYYDPRYATLRNLGTYTNDYKVLMITTEPYYDKVSVAFISLDKEV